jgi:FkbM family methyltransferase
MAASRREAFLAEAAELTPYVAARVGDEVFVVSTDDAGVGRRVFVEGSRGDIEDLDAVVARLAEWGLRAPAESVFVEVGANIGTTTVTAIRRHGFASAIALEPSPGNFRTLRINLVANDVDGRVQALPFAASDREGEVTFKTGKPNSGGHRIAETVRDKPGGKRVTVQAVTLDGLVERGTIDPARVGLLWVDAVGHEGKVLAGASRLLEAGVPVVTALRVGWPETTALLVDLLTPSYTEVVDLRDAQVARPIGELGSIVAGLEHSTDVLLVCR